MTEDLSGTNADHTSSIMPFEKPTSPIARLRALFREEIFALAAPTIMGVILVLFAPLIVASKMAGVGALAVLWITGVLLSFAVRPTWEITKTHRLLFASLSAVIFVILGWYYAAHFEPPLTEADLEAKLDAQRSQLISALFQSPGVVVTDLIAIWPINSEILRFNVNFVNQGQAAVINPIAHFGLGSSVSQIKAACEDAMFMGFDRFPAPAAKSTDILERNDTRSTTFPGTIKDEMGITATRLAELERTKMSLYLAVDIRYLDIRTKKLWQTERCEYWDFNVPPSYLSRILPHMCSGHNGVFPVEPLKSVTTACVIKPLQPP